MSEVTEEYGIPKRRICPHCDREVTTHVANIFSVMGGDITMYGGWCIECGEWYEGKCTKRPEAR